MLQGNLSTTFPLSRCDRSKGQTSGRDQAGRKVRLVVREALPQCGNASTRAAPLGLATYVGDAIANCH